jgi:hypothetical protein
MRLGAGWQQISSAASRSSSTAASPVNKVIRPQNGARLIKARAPRDRNERHQSSPSSSSLWSARRVDLVAFEAANRERASSKTQATRHHLPEFIVVALTADRVRVALPLRLLYCALAKCFRSVSDKSRELMRLARHKKASNGSEPSTSCGLLTRGESLTPAEFAERIQSTGAHATACRIWSFSCN